MPPNGLNRPGVNRTIRRVVAHSARCSGTLSLPGWGPPLRSPAIPANYIGATAPHDPPADPPTAGSRAPGRPPPSGRGLSRPLADPCSGCALRWVGLRVVWGPSPQTPGRRGLRPPDPPGSLSLRGLASPCPVGLASVARLLRIACLLASLVFTLDCRHWAMILLHFLDDNLPWGLLRLLE